MFVGVLVEIGVFVWVLVGVGVAGCVLVAVFVGVFVLVTLGVLVCVLVGVGVAGEGVFVDVVVGDGGGVPGPKFLPLISAQLTISQKLYIISINYYPLPNSLSKVYVKAFKPDFLHLPSNSANSSELFKT